MKYSYFAFYLSFLILSTACNQTSDEAGLLLPSDLKVTIDQGDNGRVNLTAEAENANFYQFDFGAGDGFTNDTDGSIAYQYQVSDTYTVKIRANATQSAFIESSETIEIILDLTNEEGYSTPLSYDGYQLVWNDEFDGNTLSSNWTYEIGTGSNGWGNNELQYYRRENTTVADGLLTITAKNEIFGGSSYTSSRIITENKQSFKYGRIDIRAVLPKGQGIWPALWMLGSNFRTIGWPRCGEIDIMEMVGGSGRENTVFGTLHWDNNGSHACTCGQNHEYRLKSGIFGDEFHVFTIIWDDIGIKWYVDDEEYTAVTFSSNMEEFKRDFFFIFNVAVGGNLPGSPDGTTTFPQQMKVDYVRVFQEN